MNSQVQQGLTIQKICTKDFEFDTWDQIHKRLVKVNIQQTFIQDNLIYYSQDGKILRIEQQQENYKLYEQFNNIDQIKYLHWEGEFGQDNRKSGKWRANWSGPVHKEVGGYRILLSKQLYYDNGLKQGLWNEFIKNYWSKAEICENGEYLNDQKYGIWKYIQNNKKIGGGLYNEQGQRQGKWIELSDGFCDYSQVTYNGEYQNGKKVGRWDIMFRDRRQNKYQQIGGGSYNAGVKSGMWIDLSDGFQIYSKATYHGIYRNGKKVGRWDIYFNHENKPLIGGGSYEEVEGDSIKIGNWVELSDLFMIAHQVTHNGEYQNGKKVGRWDILFRDQRQNKYQQIGGGTFNEGVKSGMWIELSDGFQIYQKVTCQGIYKNGKKFGRWDIKEWELQAGGSYDVFDGGSIKIGRWIEISDGFNLYSQVTQDGEYKNGKKVGRWDILYKEGQGKKYELIGGGFYNDLSLRDGKWIELNNRFYEYSKVTKKGEYKNGNKIGRWDILYKEGEREAYELIGGGFYNEQGQQNGEWRELNNEFQNQSQIIQNGQYKNGNKIGRWDILYKEEYRQIYELIGGGLYNEVKGGSIKVGQWIELDDEFEFDQQFTQKGEYQKGNKVGTWVKMIQGKKNSKKMQFEGQIIKI